MYYVVAALVSMACAVLGLELLSAKDWTTNELGLALLVTIVGGWWVWLGRGGNSMDPP
jgi:hypothetical protein